MMNSPASGLGVGPGAADFPWRATVAGEGSLILIPSETAPAESPWMLNQTGLQEPVLC